MSYTITEEQIKSIAEGGGKKKIKEMFPQVFGNKIEVGKWYKMKDVSNRSIFYVSRINGDKMFGYGLSYSGSWFNHNEKANGHIGNPNCNNLYFLATNEEVEAALIAEAKKRGFVTGAIVKCPDCFGNGVYNKRNVLKSSSFLPYAVWKDLRIDRGCESGSSYVIFRDGQWAEIIKEKTLSRSEAEELITTLKNDGNEYKIIQD